MTARLPSFVVIGVPKAGTTSLYSYLQDHPGIYMPEKGELHFFTSAIIGAACEGPGDQATYERICKTREAYDSFFEGAGHAQVVGEASPSYFFFPGCIPRLKATLGENVKLVLVLRNPVDRAHSNFTHLRRSGREALPFEEALDREEERKSNGWGDFWRYREHSHYAERLAVYLTSSPAGTSRC